MTQDFLPRFTCFPASYFPLWRCTHLMDYELIDYQESNPQRVPYIRSQDGDPPSHELHWSSQFANFHGEGSRTPHNHLVRLEIISNHELNTTATPSHLGYRETPKNNEKSTDNSRISATRCKSLSNALESHSISLEYATK
jgi:hypothetical protein